MVRFLSLRHSKRTYEPDFELPKGYVFPYARSRDQNERVTLEDLKKYPAKHESLTGRTYKSEEFPAFARITTPEKTVQDFYLVSGGELFTMMVSKRVRDKIEELEPGRHQFFPTRFLQKDGTEPWGQYFFFNIRKNVFSIDVEKSPNLHWRKTYKILDLGPKPRDPDAKPFPKGKQPVSFVCRSDLVGDCHVWHDFTGHLGPGDPNAEHVEIGLNADGIASNILKKGIVGEPPIWKSVRGYVSRVHVSDQFYDWMIANDVLGMKLEARGVMDKEEIDGDLR
jgi:hypothetical protein